MLAGCVAVVAGPDALQAQSYSAEPLKLPVAMPADSLPADRQAFGEWLMERASSLDFDTTQLAREHVYALISADAKERYARTFSAYPARADTGLARLFTWASQLGVYGAAEVAAAIATGAEDGSTGGTRQGLQLIFAPPDYILIAKDLAWMVQFPHYFMVGMMERKTLENGFDNSVVILSTLFAANAPPQSGASQATIVLASASATTPAPYALFWLQRLGFTSADTIARPVPNALRTYRNYDETNRMWKEVSVFQIPDGVVVIAYLGLDGTFQANRAHYVDLLRTLRVRVRGSADSGQARPTQPQ